MRTYFGPVNQFNMYNNRKPCVYFFWHDYVPRIFPSSTQLYSKFIFLMHQSFVSTAPPVGPENSGAGPNFRLKFLLKAPALRGLTIMRSDDKCLLSYLNNFTSIFHGADIRHVSPVVSEKNLNTFYSRD